MTIPNLPIPDTRPGYSSWQPGIGDTLGAGLAQLLQTLIQKRQLGQADRRLDLESQQNQNTADYQRGLLQNQTDDNQRQLLQFLTGQANAADVGQGLGMIGQPSMQGVQMPYNIAGGATLPAPVGAPTTIEQALLQVKPENRAAFLDKAEPLAKRGDAKAVAAAKAKAQDAFIRGLPPDLQAVGQLLSLSENGGISPELANLLGTQAVKAVKPATLAMIAKKHPEWAALPPEEQVALFVDEEKARTTARFRPPEKPSAGATAPAPISKAFTANEQTIKDLDAFIVRLGGDVENPANDKPVNPGNAFSVWNRLIPGNARQRFQVEVKGNKEMADIANQVAKIRVRPLFGTAGTQVTGRELEEMNNLLNNLNAGPEIQLQTARNLKTWLQNSNSGMQIQYPGLQSALSLDPMGALRGSLEGIPGFQKRPR